MQQSLRIGIAGLGRLGMRHAQALRWRSKLAAVAPWHKRLSTWASMVSKA